jgi:hypothetical protein
VGDVLFVVVAGGADRSGDALTVAIVLLRYAVRDEDIDNSLEDVHRVDEWSGDLEMLVDGSIDHVVDGEFRVEDCPTVVVAPGPENDAVCGPFDSDGVSVAERTPLVALDVGVGRDWDVVSVAVDAMETEAMDFVGF